MNGFSTIEQLQEVTGRHWVPVKGWEGIYCLSESGEIYSLSRVAADGRRVLKGKYLKPGKNTNGYLTYTFYNDGIREVRLLHSMLLEHFVSPRPSKQHWALHADDNKLNNSLENLRWGSPSENKEDARRNGRLAIGERIGTSKLTEEDVREIKSRSNENQYDLATEFGVSQSTISHVITGRKWSHVN